jgi:hypothetical protein
VERCLACEADGEQGESYGAPFLCLRSTTYQLSDDDFTGKRFLSLGPVSIAQSRAQHVQGDKTKMFPCLPSASQARQRSTASPFSVLGLPDLASRVSDDGATSGVPGVSNGLRLYLS